MEENKKKEIKELVEGIERLEKEASYYYGEAREPMDYNIEKTKDKLEEALKPYKEEIENIENEYNERIERLEKEASYYYGEAREPIDYNIEKIKDELATKKDEIYKELEELGVDLEEFGFKDVQEKIEPKIPVELIDTIKQRFKTMEKGYEDLLDSYYINKKDFMINGAKASQYHAERILKDIDGITLLEWYEDEIRTIEDNIKGVIEYVDESTAKQEWLEESKKRKMELEEIRDRIRARKQEIEQEKPEGPKPEGPKPEGPKPEGPKPEGPKPEGPKPEGPKPEGPKPEGPKPEGPKPEGPKPEGPKPEQAKKDELIVAIEQRFKEIEKGNEDLLLPSYLMLKEDLRCNSNIEKVIKLLEGKTLLDIYKVQLAHIEGDSKSKKEIEEAIKKIEARQRPTAPTIKNITIGKEITIEIASGKKYTSKLRRDFKDIKNNLAVTREEKIEEIKKIRGIASAWDGKEELLSKIDPNFIDALYAAKKYGVSKSELAGVLDNYINAITGNEEAKASTKQILTYDRKGMDYIKPSNMFRMLTRRKEYDQIKEYALEAEDNNMSGVKLDKPGFIRKLLYKNRPLMIGNEDVYMKTDEERKESINKKVNRQYKKPIRTKKQLQEQIEVSDEVKEKLEQVEKEYANGSNSNKYGSLDMNVDINKKLSKASKEMEEEK